MGFGGVGVGKFSLDTLALHTPETLTVANKIVERDSRRCGSRLPAQ